MPLFEYACEDCGSRFEKLVQGGGDRRDGIECPQCGSARTERQLSTFATRGTDSGGSGGSGRGACAPSAGFS